MTIIFFSWLLFKNSARCRELTFSRRIVSAFTKSFSSIKFSLTSNLLSILFFRSFMRPIRWWRKTRFQPPSYYTPSYRLTLSWTDGEVGVPQGSVLGPLMFLISENLSCKSKLFADDTSLFSMFRNNNTSVNDLNNNLNKIRRGVHQWKINFNLQLGAQVI